MSGTETIEAARGSRRVQAVKAPAGLKVERAVDGGLTAIKDGAATAVRVCRCFPWSSPQAHISLRDDKDNEIAFLKSPAELDEDSRCAVELAMAEAGFVFEIESIETAEEIFEIR